MPIDTVIEAFEAGATPEEICADYPALRQEAVESVLVYYSAHRAEVDRYLAERRRRAAENRHKLEVSGGWNELRRRLLAGGKIGAWCGPRLS